jgi:hypothetical protein
MVAIEAKAICYKGWAAVLAANHYSIYVAMTKKLY